MRLSVAVEMEFQCRIGGALLGEILQLLGHPGIFGCCSREPGKFVEELRHLGRRQDQGALRVDPLQHGMAAASSTPVDEADESVVGIGRDGDGGELPALRAAATSLHSHQRHIHTHDHIIVRTPGEISGPFGVRLVEPNRPTHPIRAYSDMPVMGQTEAYIQFTQGFIALEETVTVPSTTQFLSDYMTASRATRLPATRQ